MMAFGLGVLRLSASTFWGLTLPEFKAALRGHRGEIGILDPISRDAFAALMQRFPDIAAQPETPDFHS
jgi:uncharacterized phage protein (TIGR02216 family)